MGFPSIDTEFLSWAFGRTSLLIGHSPRPPILVRLCAEPRFLVSTGRETKFLLASEGHHKFQLRVTQNSFCGEQYVTRSSAFRIPAHRSLQNGSTTNCSLVRAYPGHAGPHLECVTIGREARDMNVEVRAFEAADVCAMVRIWNEVVEEGPPFPRRSFWICRPVWSSLVPSPPALSRQTLRAGRCTASTFCTPTTWGAAATSATQAMRSAPMRAACT
jgi:hypothetical protein